MNSRDHHHHSLSSSSRSHLLMEDRIQIQHQEIKSIIGKNQHLAATHVAIKQELDATKREIQRLIDTAPAVKAERDAQVHELYQSSLKAEADARIIRMMNAEIDQVRADLLKLTATRHELLEKFRGVDQEVAKAKSELQRVPVVKAEIKAVQEQIQKGRAAIEIENQTSSSNLQHKEVMDKNMDILAREIEKLRQELANAEERARTNLGYAMNYGCPDMGYGGMQSNLPSGTYHVQDNRDSLPYQPLGTM